LEQAFAHLSISVSPKLVVLLNMPTLGSPAEQTASPGPEGGTQQLWQRLRAELDQQARAYPFCPTLKVDAHDLNAAVDEAVAAITSMSTNHH
jgi:hypothetical protein